MCSFLAGISEPATEVLGTSVKWITFVIKKGTRSEHWHPLQQCSGLCRARKKPEHPGEQERGDPAKVLDAMKAG